jgi:hypothetical protein
MLGVARLPQQSKIKILSRACGSQDQMIPVLAINNSNLAVREMWVYFFLELILLNILNSLNI